MLFGRDRLQIAKTVRCEVGCLFLGIDVGKLEDKAWRFEAIIVTIVVSNSGKGSMAVSWAEYHLEINTGMFQSIFCRHYLRHCINFERWKDIQKIQCISCYRLEQRSIYLLNQPSRKRFPRVELKIEFNISENLWSQWKVDGHKGGLQLRIFLPDSDLTLLLISVFLVWSTFIKVLWKFPLNTSQFVVESLFTRYRSKHLSTRHYFLFLLCMDMWDIPWILLKSKTTTTVHLIT